MPTYISLIRYTQQGVENMKESPARLDTVKSAIEAAGGKYIGFYLTMGQYDAVLIAEAPNDETVATVSLAIAAGGSTRTETLRAFTEDEYRKIIANLP
jgi:uncharacterized protein with GYD domain